jgi:cysteine desulfurase
MYAEKGNHIITATIEHKAVLDPCKHLESKGFQVTYVPVDKFGQVDPQKIREAITDKTILISIMHANNEIGTINNIAAIGAIAAEKDILFHTDAAQTLGKIPIDVQAMNVHLLSASAHKIYGPKGVGFLYIRKRNPRVRVNPIMYGGGHERGVRSGTLNVPGIVGMGKAVEIALSMMSSEHKRLAAMRDSLKTKLFDSLEEIYLNGHPTEHLPHNLNISFAFVEGESLLMGFNRLAVSSGSACTSASLEPSYVLKGIGVGEDLAHTSIRFSFGRFNQESDVNEIADEVIKTVKRLREMSPLYEMFKEGIDVKKIQWATH